jgi:hypothetical protein
MDSLLTIERNITKLIKVVECTSSQISSSALISLLIMLSIVFSLL